MKLSQEEEWLLREKYGGEKTSGFFADCKRLAAGEPLGYVIGWVPFLHTNIYLDSKPLIPRHETEFWVEKAIKEIQKFSSTAATAPRILDLCAGSGCVGVAIAEAIPEACVDFGEIDANHLQTIKKNLQENNIDLARIHIYESNLFESISGTYDYIFTNPPYIDPALDRTEPSVRDHEPHIALYGGTDGMELIASSIATAPTHLTEHGQLWVEHEPVQAIAIQSLAKSLFTSTTTYPDQFGISRYSILKR